MSVTILPPHLEDIVAGLERDIVRPPWLSADGAVVDPAAPDHVAGVPGVPEPPD